MSDEGHEAGVESQESGVHSPESTVDGPEPEDSELALEDEVEASAHTFGLELPADPAAAQALLLRELAETRMEAGETLQNLQRIAAEFDNYRRRVERDHAENIERASQRVIESMLPVLDSFDAALEIEPQTDAEKQILDGMASTKELLLETLARDGLEPISAVGWPFDPKVHEAVSGAQQGDGELVVTSELRRGYTMHDRVIRPTLVTVDHA